MVGYNHRFHDGFIKAKRYDIGKPIFIRAKYGFGGRPGYEKEWRLNREVSGGGHLIDLGVHLIDSALLFMGKPKIVRSCLSDTFWKKGVEDNAFVLIQDKNKVTASIHVSLTQWKPTHVFEVYGTKGYLCIDGLEAKYGNGEKLIVGKNGKEKVIKCNCTPDNSLAVELKEFISAIRHKKVIDNTSAYETLKVVEQVYKDNKL